MKHWLVHAIQLLLTRAEQYCHFGITIDTVTNIHDISERSLDWVEQAFDQSLKKCLMVGLRKFVFVMQLLIELYININNCN